MVKSKGGWEAMKSDLDDFEADLHDLQMLVKVEYVKGLVMCTTIA